MARRRAVPSARSWGSPGPPGRGRGPVAPHPQQGGERRLDRGRERQRVVPALQEQSQAPRSGRELLYHAGQLGEVPARQARAGPADRPRWASNPHETSTQSGRKSSIVSAGHLVECGAEHVARCARWQRHVEGQAGSPGTADLVGAARSGEQRVLVGRDVEDVGVVPEDRLRAVAVVHVPVDDQDPLTQCGARGGGNGHVVDEAEAHRPVGRGVVARRPHGHEGDARRPAVPARRAPPVPLPRRAGRRSTSRGGRRCPGRGPRLPERRMPRAGPSRPTSAPGTARRAMPRGPRGTPPRPPARGRARRP